MLRSTLVALAISTSLFLAGCGGGGEDTYTINGQPTSLRPCAVDDSVALTAVYDIGATSYRAGTLVYVPRTQSVVASPRIQGLPSSCANSVFWKFSATTSPIAGLRLDQGSGFVSGTPRSGEVLEVDVTWLIVGSPRAGSGQFRFIAQ